MGGRNGCMSGGQDGEWSSMDSSGFVLRLPVSNRLNYGTKTHFRRYQKKLYDDIIK
jgi:hypothetical protein